MYANSIKQSKIGGKMEQEKKDKVIQIRVTENEKEELRRKAKEAGFSNLGEYLRVRGKKL